MYSELYWVVAWNLTNPGLYVFSVTPSLKLSCYAELRWHDSITSCSQRDGIERSAVLIGCANGYPATLPCGYPFSKVLAAGLQAQSACHESKLTGQRCRGVQKDKLTPPGRMTENRGALLRRRLY